METKDAIETARAFLINARLTESQIKTLEDWGYFDAPAAMKHHLNRPHGLCEHSVNVSRKLLGLEVFKLRESAYRVGMLHDLVKVFCYKAKEVGGKVSYAWRTPPYPGHGVCSAMLCDDLGLTLTPEERNAIIWHMGAFNLSEDDQEAYRVACERFPRQIILTHAADHLSSVYETLQDRAEGRGKANEESEGGDA